MIENLTFIFPCDPDRVSLFEKTLDHYMARDVLRGRVEFLVVSRSFHHLPFSCSFVRVIHYDYPFEDFNPAMALNIGIQNAQCDNIVFTSPEVRPQSNVITQLMESERDNYLCKVWDLNERGYKTRALVTKHYRSQHPGMYFLACFKKEDLVAINGVDEAFCGGYACEDEDFGHRFNRAGLKFTLREDIIAHHQYHERVFKAEPRKINGKILLENDMNGIIRCKNGLEKL